MFGWSRRSCPIDAGAKRWAEDRIGLPLGQFGRERLQQSKIVLPNRRSF